MFPKKKRTILIAAALVALAVPAQRAAADDFLSAGESVRNSESGKLTRVADALSKNDIRPPAGCDAKAALNARSADNADELNAELFAMTADNFDLARVCELMQAGADPNALDEQRDLRPLHLAIEAASLSGVSYLLSAGADPNLRRREGHTALDWAIKFARQDPETYDFHKALLRLYDAHCNVNC